MTDQYPESFEIEIDRDALYKYLRVKWLGTWALWSVGIIVIIGIFIIAGYVDNHDNIGIQGLIFIVYTGFGIGLLVTAIVTVPALPIFIYFMAGNMAKTLNVSVEGAFLHIVQENFIRVDRKLHFRAITDYSTVDDLLMRRFGLKALRMTTTGGGLNGIIQINGIKDCLKVRDMLAEIDSIRENA